MGKVFERSLKYINLLILLLLLCGLAATWWYGWRTLPETDGTVEAAISAEGVIRRDRLGVPHIEAASIEDAMFLQGYATAQDRLWQLDALRRSTAGELAEVAGRAVLAADVEARRIGFQRTALVQAAQLDPKDRAIFASYARGVNHYIDTHRNRLPPEFTLLGYEPRPWTISDSVLVALRMAGDLSTSWKTDLDTERMRRELAGTFPELDDEQREQLLQRLYPVRDGAEALAGSNAWAISGAHTASGKPLLANDTHLAVRFPAIWTMVHLKAGKLNVKGFALPGLPGVIVGHNERIAWGTTNLGADVQDLYEERIDLASGRYQYGNEVRQASRIVETIRVRGEADQRLSVAVTHHGPLIHTSADPGLKRNLALRWTALAPDFLRYPFLDINLAGNWEEFRAALSRFSGPPQNFMYADVDGNIGYQAAGRIPLRRNGEGNVPLPGFLPTSEWTEYIPFEELPAVYNPPSGWIVSGNQNPFPENYPYQVNGRYAPADRANQIIARLGARKDWDAPGMADIQKDVYSPHYVFVAKQVIAAAEKHAPEDAFVREAVEKLRSWDGQAELEESGATIARVASDAIRTAILKKVAPRWEEADIRMGEGVVQWVLQSRNPIFTSDFDAWVMDVFTEALSEGRKSLGGDLSKWRYREISVWEVEHPVFARLPLLGRWLGNRKVAVSGSPSSPKQVLRALGPSQRFVADLGDWERSLGVLPLGVSGHPLSKHFRDQWDDYYDGAGVPMPFGGTEFEDVQRFVPAAKSK